jgi:putative hydrolase of the HAD superfamily
MNFLKNSSRRRNNIPLKNTDKDKQKNGEKSQPPYIALDVGNCCIKVDTEECLKRIGLSSLAEVPPSFISACDKLECGFISEKEWLVEFKKSIKGSFSDKYLVEAWLSIIGKEIPGMPEALRRISASGCRIIFFSDTSNLHIKYAIGKMSLSVYVSGGIYSFEVGAKKPDEKMFAAFEKKYAVPLLYTDDKEENIIAAKKRGWPAELFKNADDFMEQFKSRFF